MLHRSTGRPEPVTGRAAPRPLRALLLPLLLPLLRVAAGATLASCNPVAQGDVPMGQALIELGDALNGVREENALLQAQVDSLRDVVARQDTLLRRLAGAAGVPVAP